MKKKIIFKNATIVTMDASFHIYRNYNIIVSNGIIAEIVPSVNKQEDCEIVDCCHKLITPGFINAHLHSCETSFRGLYDNLPLEQWMYYAYPPFKGLKVLSRRYAYLRTMCGAIEQLHSGVTCCQDDVAGFPGNTMEEHDQIFQAYSDLGIKANVSFSFMDKHNLDTVPYIRSLIPASLKEKIAEPVSTDFAISKNEELISAWNGKNNMKVLISNSAPQRCTDAFSQKLFAQAERHDLPYHTHICETRTQRITGFEFYGKPIMQHAADIGILSPRTTVAHCNWLDDKDIETAASKGANIVHNIVSNLKLSSGIMPYRKLLRAGVNVTLGTDGTSTNDSQNIMEVMKTAALIHKVTQPDYTQGPSSREILSLSTTNAAKSVMRQNEIGSIEVGKQADFVIFDLNSPSFTPLNHIENQLIYCQSSSAISDVYVNGRAVMKNRKITTVDENALLHEFQSMTSEFLDMYQKDIAPLADEMKFYIDQAYWQCIKNPDSLWRFSASKKEYGI